VSDESQLQVSRKDDGSSLILWLSRSSLVARGRLEAELLEAQVRPESEEERSGLFEIAWDGLGDRPLKEVQKDAEQGDARNQNLLAFGYCFGNERNLGEAAKWYRRAADQGYAVAQFNLGRMYDNPYLGVPGVGQDYVEAAKWYRKAADQNFAPAQFNLGVMYDIGEGVAQDYVEAAKWYRKAAEQGLHVAQFNLGLKYEKGEGVAQDSTVATTWYRKAAEQGFGAAQFNLGLMYMNGQGVVHDDVQAHMWMTLASAHANVDNGKRYAAISDKVAATMNPSQISEAQRLAVSWYRKAAEQGCVLAQRRLGAIFANGLGVSQDHIEAAWWYSHAANQGDTPSQDALGWMYLRGQGVPVNYARAYMWFTLAASRQTESSRARDALATKMTPQQIAEGARLAREWRTSAGG
jgi:TPR repeat protein